MHISHAVALSALAASALALPSKSLADCKKVQHAQKDVSAAPQGTIISGVLWVTTTITTTITVPATQAPAAASPTTSSSASVAAAVSAAPVPQSAAPDTPAVNTPAASTPVASTLAAQPITTTSAAALAPAPAATTATPDSNGGATIQTAPAQAAASPSPAPSSGSSASSSGLTAAQVLAIIPGSDSCAGAQKPAECITNDKAAPAIANSFTMYKITSKGAQAAIISLMGFESGGYKYNVNLNNANQGTRNMMMSTFIEQYASAALGSKATGDAVTDLGLLNADENLSSGSGAWYMNSKCPDLVAQFDSAPDTAWQTYISQCVGTPLTDERTAYWTRAKTALGVN
jgi:hypothetical protein